MNKPKWTRRQLMKEPPIRSRNLIRLKIIKRSTTASDKAPSYQKSQSSTMPQQQYTPGSKIRPKTLAKFSETSRTKCNSQVACSLLLNKCSAHQSQEPIWRTLISTRVRAREKWDFQVDLIVLLRVRST